MAFQHPKDLAQTAILPGMTRASLCPTSSLWFVALRRNPLLLSPMSAIFRFATKALPSGLLQEFTGYRNRGALQAWSNFCNNLAVDLVATNGIMACYLSLS